MTKDIKTVTSDSKFCIVQFGRAARQPAECEDASFPRFLDTDRPITGKGDGLRWLSQNAKTLEYGTYGVVQVKGVMQIGPKEVPECTVLE